MPGTRKTIPMLVKPKPHELFDYVAIHKPLHQNITGGSTTKLTYKLPRDPNQWQKQLRMLKEYTIWDSPQDMKFCRHCGDWRPKNQFNHDHSRPDGLDGWCRVCKESERLRRKWMQEDSEQMMQTWRARHIDRLASVLLFDEFKEEDKAA